MLKPAYPNLELLEHQFKTILDTDEDWQKRFIEFKEFTRYKDITEQSFDVIVFPQIWCNSNMAFDLDNNGNFTVGIDAMIKSYTVVFREIVTNTYGVFVDNRFCYLVTEPTQYFYDDLRSRQLQSVSKALDCY